MQVEDFGPFTLSANAHDNPAEGMCVMEMVSFLAGEEWSDMPKCASPVVANYCQILNDNGDQSVRDRLQTYVPRLIGTAAPEHDQARAEYLAWQTIRVFVPIALRRAGLTKEADELASFSGDLTAACADPACYSFLSGVYCAAYYAAATAHYDPVYSAGWAAKSAVMAEAWGEAFDALDGLLEVGPSGQSYTQEHLNRVTALRELVNA